MRVRVMKNQNRKSSVREVKKGHESRIHPVGPIDKIREVVFFVLFVCFDFEAQVVAKGRPLTTSMSAGCVERSCPARSSSSSPVGWCLWLSCRARKPPL